MLMHFAKFGVTKTSAAKDNQLPAAWTRLKLTISCSKMQQ